MKKGNIRLRKFNKRINKTSFVLTIGAGICSLNLFASLPSFYQVSEEIPYTEEDIQNNQIYEQEYASIQEEELDFENKDLLRIIKEQYSLEEVTKEELAKIKQLEISPLTNQDLSDLKYCTYLEELSIEGIRVNLEDLQYNQYLTKIKCNECILFNTFYLPNSIQEMDFDFCQIEDAECMIPYNTIKISFGITNFHNLHLKNPSALKFFFCQTNSLLDLEWLKDCEELEEMQLCSCDNVKNPYILNELKKTNISLDEMCLLWMPTSALESLIEENRLKTIAIEYNDTKLETKLQYLLIFSRTLDKIAAALSEAGMSEEEKICQITLYLIKKYSYYSGDLTYEIGLPYNVFPISSALESDEIVCINYASMFTALANRMGLDVYQATSSNHAWNQVFINGEIKNYDITSLDYWEDKMYGVIDDNLLFLVDGSPISFLEEGKGQLLAYYAYAEEQREVFGEPQNNPIQSISTENQNIGYVLQKEQKNDRKKVFGLLVISLSSLFLAGGLQVFKGKVNDAIDYRRRQNILKKIRKEY